MPTTEHRAGTIKGIFHRILAVPDSLELEPFLADLGKEFQIVTEKEPVETVTWFDTDDWRLYRRDLILFQDGLSWHLVSRSSGKEAAYLPVQDWQQPELPSALPESRMKELVAPVVSIRSLLPLTTQAITSIFVRIRNRDQKTVALVFLQEHNLPGAGGVFRTLTLTGVRGYENSCEKVLQFLSSYGIVKETVHYAGLVNGARSLGRVPCDYSSKFKAVLDRSMTAREAMIQIYRQLLGTMQHNESGIVADLDPEFLHDFRVAVRRTRSGLGQVREVLPEDVVLRAKKDLAWLGSITGPTRDLDVYLLDREKYMQRLPKHLQPKLAYFFTDLAKRRQKERELLVSHMKSSRYRQVINSWQTYLASDDLGEATKFSAMPVSELAGKIIIRKFRKILKSGGAITRSSPDEELHRLRIHCKKLRYILEFFSPLFSARKMKQAIRQLKRLQDNLGMFNDLSVQQDMLRNYLTDLQTGSRRSQELATAIGGLLTNLYHQQQKIRKEFYRKFTLFSSGENRRLYRKLFD